MAAKKKTGVKSVEIGAKPTDCPKCGSDPKGTLDTVLGVALIGEHGGQWQYEGETEVNWDSQSSVIEKGRKVLVCSNNHCGEEYPAPKGFEVI